MTVANLINSIAIILVALALALHAIYGHRDSS